VGGGAARKGGDLFLKLRKKMGKNLKKTLF